MRIPLLTQICSWETGSTERPCACLPLRWVAQVVDCAPNSFAGSPCRRVLDSCRMLQEGWMRLQHGGNAARATGRACAAWGKAPAARTPLSMPLMCWRGVLSRQWQVWRADADAIMLRWERSGLRVQGWAGERTLEVCEWPPMLLVYGPGCKAGA